jgi:hypothetical protein
MTTKHKVFRASGVILFAIGVLLGMALTAVTIWTDLEASFFDSALASRGDEALRTLRCPVLMAKSETGTIRATFQNPTEKPIELMLRAHITDGFVTLMREVNTTLPLEPGEKETVEWSLTADDVAYRWLILARVLQFRYSPLPARQAACGVLVVDVPFLTGNQLFILVIVVAFLSIVGGMALWGAGNWPLKSSPLATFRTMAALSVILLIGFLVSFLASWLIGALLFAVTLLLILEILRQVITAS